MIVELRIRRWRRLFCVVAGAWSAGAVCLAAPVEIHGGLGYTYRSISGSSNDDTSSHQFRGLVDARGYLWRPWFATVQGSLRATQDYADVEGTGGNTTTITTGDLNLSLLPRSRTPFEFSFRTSDSRVDAFDIASPVTGLGNNEYNNRRWSIKQSLLTEDGDRYQIRYDNNHWSSKIGATFDDELFGAEMDLLLPKQRLFAKGSYQTSEQSVLRQETRTAIVNIDHFYHPSRALRVDTMFSHFDSDRNSDQPLNGTNNNGNGNLRLTQVSSFVFWRPARNPLTASGGVRVHSLSRETTSGQGSGDTLSMTGNAGLFYQMTRNLRLDASLDLTVNDNGDRRRDSTRARGGVLYQSDIHDVLSGFRYQWHASTRIVGQSTDALDTNDLTVRFSHDLQRSWRAGNGGTARLSLSQSVGAVRQFGDLDASTERLDHSASLSWDRFHGGGTSYLQLTVSDARSFGDYENNQQFVNIQAQRRQTLDGRRSLSGNLTVQAVYQDFNGRANNDTVTATGQLSYRHADIFGVPRLRFVSDLRSSRADVDSGIDRTEWENRLNYAIGLVDASLSWRRIVLDDEGFNLIYLQVDRRF